MCLCGHVCYPRWNFSSQECSVHSCFCPVPDKQHRRRGIFPSWDVERVYTSTNRSLSPISGSHGCRLLRRVARPHHQHDAPLGVAPGTNRGGQLPLSRPFQPPTPSARLFRCNFGARILRRHPTTKAPLLVGRHCPRRRAAHGGRVGPPAARRARGAGTPRRCTKCC